MALVRAATKFDPTLDRDFLTYAVPTISGELKRYFRDHGWTVRPPRRIQEIQSRVLAAQALTREDGTIRSAEDIAMDLALKVDDVREALQAKGCFQPASLDLRVGKGREHTVGEVLLADEDTDYDIVEARTMVEPVLRKLSERDRRILALRFSHDQTQQQISQEIGVTQMQVSRLSPRSSPRCEKSSSTSDRVRTRSDGRPSPSLSRARRGVAPGTAKRVGVRVGESRCDSAQGRLGRPRISSLERARGGRDGRDRSEAVAGRKHGTPAHAERSEVPRSTRRPE